MTLSNNANVNRLSNCAATPPIQGMALVAEGGGQRGIFTAGVLDSWLLNNFNPFELLIGTSAGAQNLSSYMTNQVGYARQSIMELSKHPQFFNMKRTLWGRSAVDLDWYFDQVNNSFNQLNIDCGLSRMKTRRLLFSATRADNLAVKFFEPERENWITTLKASSALPFLYKNGVTIGDNNYVDGGVSSPVPIQEAYSLGAKKIITIRTVPTQHNAKSEWAHKLKSWVCNENRCPKVLDVITQHENSYTKAIEFIKSPPSDVSIIELSPPRPLLSKLVGSSEEALNADYELGMEVGLAYLKSVELH